MSALVGRVEEAVMSLMTPWGLMILVFSIMFSGNAHAQRMTDGFSWPDSKRAAVSLSFDDARLSQVDLGIALLNRYGINATFFVVPSGVEQRLEGWKKAVSTGHEIGNHSLNHPCTGNFPWARQKALEEYTSEKMRFELSEAGRRIAELLGVKAETFAYPCGQKVVGRGVQAKSYVPLVAEMFVAGRGWLDEVPNDPGFCDLAQLTGMPMDGLDFEQVLRLIESAKQRAQWIVLAGHEIGAAGQQTTRVGMLETLLQYLRDPANECWVAPVGTVAKYVQRRRGKMAK